jgi:hypothetical protein
MPAIRSEATIASSGQQALDHVIRASGPQFRGDREQPLGAAAELG